MGVGHQNVDQIIIRCRWATTEHRQVELYVTGGPFAQQPTDPDHPPMHSRQVWTEARENESGSQSTLSGQYGRARHGQWRFQPNAERESFGPSARFSAGAWWFLGMMLLVAGSTVAMQGVLMIGVVVLIAGIATVTAAAVALMS